MNVEPHPFVKGFLFALFLGTVMAGVVAILVQFVLWGALFEGMHLAWGWAALPGFITAAVDKNGNEYFASSAADGGTNLWLIERCKLRLLNVGAESVDGR